MAKVAIAFTLNGIEQTEFAESGSTLLSVLRDKLGFTATKSGCNQGTCGACTVLIDGEPRLACLTLAERCRGGSVETVDGLGKDGVLHPLQQAFIDGFAAQCGYCTPGMILAAKALLDRNRNPTRADVIDAISGNICRCTGYEPIIAAILAAAEMTRAKQERARQIRAGETSALQRNDERITS
jgi:aerobic carbon-monoxide dehydrogenase small subunit